jgi:hypothetical protein
MGGIIQISELLQQSGRGIPLKRYSDEKIVLNKRMGEKQEKMDD